VVRRAFADDLNQGQECVGMRQDELTVRLACFGEYSTESPNSIVVLACNGLVEGLPQSDDTGDDELYHFDIVFHLLCFVDQIADYINGVVKKLDIAESLESESEEWRLRYQARIEFTCL
jgi:hypothetical protein